METPEMPCRLFETYFQNVYEPAEDSFLLVDALEQDIEAIREMRATDINPVALECTSKCVKHNQTKFNVELVQSDLSRAFASRLGSNVDILLFNPPYVPTPDSEIDNDGGIRASWAGGIDGSTIIYRFIKETLAESLSLKGYAYLIVFEKNNIEKIRMMAKNLNFDCREIIKRKCGIEKLSVLRFHRI